MKLHELLNNRDFNVNAEVDIVSCYYPSKDPMEIVARKDLKVYSSTDGKKIPEEIMDLNVFYVCVSKNKNGDPCLVVYCRGFNTVNEEQLEWINCFEIESDYQAYWLYYNPDGNNGNGQIVEISIHPDDVPIKETNEDHFWGYLSYECKTWLHDREDEDFNEYALDMMNWPSDSDTHRNGLVKDTMQWLIDWAKKE